MDRKILPLKVSALERLTGKRQMSVSDQITGMASDLETRSLLLVINYSRVWNGLSADQQRQLQRQIVKFSPSTGMIQVASSHFLTSGQKVAAISGRWTVLAQPFRSFWIEVLRIVAWMKQQYQGRSAARLMSGRHQVEGAGFGLRRLPEVSMPDCDEGAIAREPMLTAIAHGIAPLAAIRSEARSNVLIAQGADKTTKPKGQPYCLEADVITVGYIEHPFEKLLKWIDRILVWLEAHWKLVKHRLGR